MPDTPCQNKVPILISVAQYKERFPDSEPHTVFGDGQFPTPMTVYLVQCGQPDQFGRTAYCSRCFSPLGED